MFFFLFFFCPTILCPNWGRECVLLVSVVCLVGEVEVFVGIVVVVCELWRFLVIWCAVVVVVLVWRVVWCFGVCLCFWEEVVVV